MTYEEKKSKIGKIEKTLEISKNNEQKQKEKLKIQNLMKPKTVVQNFLKY